MYVVAIAELRGDIDAEAAPLAADLAVTAYQARLLLAPGTPAVLLTTPDKARALDLLARVRARGHGAVACDLAAVVDSADMVSMRRFRLGADAVDLEDRPGERLPYDDVLALVAAVHRHRTDTSTRTRETRFSASRAVMTSGLSMTRTIQTESHASHEERDAVLYVFRRSGSTPWILHEHGTAWAGHGRPLAASAHENFRLAVAALRELAPGAAHDDRLVTRKAPEQASVQGGAASTTVRTSSQSGMDLLAHLVALSAARREAERPR